MNKLNVGICALTCLTTLNSAFALAPVKNDDKEPVIPRFSVDYMDKSQSPKKDFYRYASGTWIKNNPVPADKARWNGFSELTERNNYLIHGILRDARDAAAADLTAGTKPRNQVGNFFASGMNVDVIEKKQFAPIKPELDAIEQIKSKDDLFKLLGQFHKSGHGGIFYTSVDADAKDSGIYAFQMMQGGLSLPDRDYYLSENFAKQREGYLAHLQKMFAMLGESKEASAKSADTVFKLEKELAQVSRSRVELRDPIKNYNKVKAADLIKDNPEVPWQAYLNERQIENLPYAVVGQPEFFDALNKIVKDHSLDEWKTYLRWKVLHGSAPFLHDAVEVENFNFFGKALSGQEVQEPRWKRVAKVVDQSIGEALGQLYVEKYFTEEARKRMSELVTNLREVFSDRLQHLEWMSEETRKKAMAKFERFVQKIGHPDKFRDYSSVVVKADDYLGNVKRAEAFDIARNVARIGKPVDKSEWAMTPPTVNAYFNPTMNEIVFPAGILQPPFFDTTMDDAVNYGGIGAVIGHEITHGYDDEGRHYDADGNLKEWWSEADAKEFDKRAARVVEEYNGFEALPGLHVNGKLTLGENIADLGGVSIGYDALQRALKKDPSKRKTIDGFTPEQRFFLAFAQLWRINVRDTEQRRLITVDPHSPGQFRSVGPLLNFQQFYDAFDIKAGDPVWVEPEKRAVIW
jgi:putative endopeptidase